MSIDKINTKFEKYSEYKDSGVDWLGEIPEGWKTIKLKFIVTINVNTLPENFSKSNKIDYVDIGSVSYENGIENIEKLSFAKAPSRARRIARENDTIVSTVRTYLKAIDFIDLKKSHYIYSTGFAILQPQISIVFPKYINTFIKSSIFTNQVDIASKGMSYPAINSTDLSNLLICVPPLEEQKQIATFLDNKTAKIDQAIAQKEKLITLLKERKQIMIQNAVTKGLDPDAEMKDSGVEWIGEIPVGWEVKALKHIAVINKQSLPENTRKDFVFDYVDIGSVSFSNGIENTERFSFKKSPSRARRIAYSGNTIISTVRTYLKAIDYVSKEKSSFIYSTGFAILQANAISDKFLYHFVRSDAFTEQVTVNSTGMSYPAINSTELGKLWLAIPPRARQNLIVTYIETQSTKIDKAIALQQKQIDKLKEYKAVLIDSAVTGKIKVC